MILLQTSGLIIFFNSVVVMELGSIISLANTLHSWPLGCHLLHAGVRQQTAFHQAPHLSTQSIWMMLLRTPQAKMPAHLIILFGSKAGRVHSQSTQHYPQRIRATSQPAALSNTIGHILWEGGVVSWEQHMLWQMSFNSQHGHLPAGSPGQVPPTQFAFL